MYYASNGQRIAQQKCQRWGGGRRCGRIAAIRARRSSAWCFRSLRLMKRGDGASSDEAGLTARQCAAAAGCSRSHEILWADASIRLLRPINRCANARDVLLRAIRRRVFQPSTFEQRGDAWFTTGKSPEQLHRVFASTARQQCAAKVVTVLSR
jgi:hypothetical protein